MTRPLGLLIVVIMLSSCAMGDHVNWKDRDRFSTASSELSLLEDEANDYFESEAKRPIDYSSEYRSSHIPQAKVSAGMSKRTVVAMYGEPNDVRVAGNHKYENEKWVYRRYVPSQAGYVNDTKVIYFEQGRVAGWD